MSQTDTTEGRDAGFRDGDQHLLRQLDSATLVALALDCGVVSVPPGTWQLSSIATRVDRELMSCRPESFDERDLEALSRAEASLRNRAPLAKYAHPSAQRDFAFRDRAADAIARCGAVIGRRTAR